MKNIVMYSLALFIASVSIQEVKSQDNPRNKKDVQLEKQEIKTPDRIPEVKTDKKPVKSEIKLDTKINPTQTSSPDGGRGEFENIVSQSKPIIETKSNGIINWTEQYIEAKGQSIIDYERFKIPAQAKAMATRGAVVVAQRNLLEIINGVNVTSETKVQDLITVSDYIYTRVDGIIKGAQQVGEPVEKDGMIEVTMRVPLYSKDGLASAVRDAVPQTTRYSQYQPQSTDNKVEKGNETQTQTQPEAIAFNLNGKKYDPSLFPIIVDDKGNLLLDYSKIYDANKGDFPKILNVSKELISSISPNSKAVELVNVISAEPGKLVIDSKHSKSFWSKFGNTAGKIAKFLMFLL